MGRRQLMQSEIYSFFRLYGDGKRVSEIARLTQCNRNTVRDHLAGRYRYPKEMADRLRALRRRWTEAVPTIATPDGCLTIDEACWLIPSRPCWQTVLKYMQAGRLKSEKYQGKYFTRPQWVREFVAKHFEPLPEGIAIYRKHSPMLLDVSPTPKFWKRLPKGLRIGLQGQHNTHLIFTNMLWEVRAAAQEAYLAEKDHPQLQGVLAASALLAKCEDRAFILLMPSDLGSR